MIATGRLLRTSLVSKCVLFPQLVRPMSDRIIKITDEFWNIRGSFRIMGFLDIGTQASLVRQANGKYLFLDSYTLVGSVKRQVLAATNDGADIEAILNLHPFHTVHCARMHRDFPNAKLYGTARHLDKFPDLPWESELTEKIALHDRYSDILDFTVPRGVDFISKNESVHFSSVLAYHPASKTIHSDDTLMYLNLPFPLNLFGPSHPISFHPTLGQALEKREGAAAEFRQWADELTDNWSSAVNLCAAHTAAFTENRLRGASMGDLLAIAVENVEPTLVSHERKFG